jgi:hypothetical protein
MARRLIRGKYSSFLSPDLHARCVLAPFSAPHCVEARRLSDHPRASPLSPPAVRIAPGGLNPLPTPLESPRGDRVRVDSAATLQARYSELPATTDRSSTRSRFLEDPANSACHLSGPEYQYPSLFALFASQVIWCKVETMALGLGCKLPPTAPDRHHPLECSGDGGRPTGNKL